MFYKNNVALMKKFSIFLVFGACLLLAGCGEKMKEIKHAGEIIQKAPEAADKMDDLQQKAETRLAERRKVGDTLAVHFTKLQEFLPKNVSDYTLETPQGATTGMGGFSFSSAEYNFTKDNGESRIRISIVDYNASYATWAGFASWAILGLKTENQDGWIKTFPVKINDIYALEEYSRNSKIAKATYAVGYRFLLTIEANNQISTNFVKSIANRMNLLELAKM